LVGHIGVFADDKRIKLNLPYPKGLSAALALKGLDIDPPYLVLHPGVSEIKRTYAFENWISTGRLLSRQGMRLLITGNAAEAALVNALCDAIGENAISLAGQLSMAEFALVISRARVVVSVNTGTVHLAAAFGTPVVVLYAMSNPQHTPWMVPSRVLPYPVAQAHKSKNKVIAHVDRIYDLNLPQPDALTVLNAVTDLLKSEE
jgi:ADP-heptose:LPS heptosyltransferase